MAAILFASAAAYADEPVEDAKTAIAERGIVLKAGKRNLFVVVPLAEPRSDTPKGSVFHKSRVFFGDAKALIELPGDFNTYSEGEYRDLGNDPRWINVQKLWRRGEQYKLTCGTTFGHTDKSREIALVPGDAKAVTNAVIKDAPRVRLAYALARQSTTYIYVDRLEGEDMRIFVGKRGAMKQLTIKDAVDDSKALVVVTAKGTFTLTKAAKKGDPLTATFGPEKKPTAADVLPIDNNRKLIYRELGVYSRERTGQPCDEL